MSSSGDHPQSFDDLDMPTMESEAVADAGMPDPTAEFASADDASKASKVRRKRSRDAGGPSLLARATKASPYTVLLAVSLLFLLLGIFCLFREYGSFHYDSDANAAKIVWATGQGISHGMGGADRFWV